jgi:hypothetical protein
MALSSLSMSATKAISNTPALYTLVGEPPSVQLGNPCGIEASVRAIASKLNRVYNCPPCEF